MRKSRISGEIHYATGVMRIHQKYSLSTIPSPLAGRGEVGAEAPGVGSRRKTGVADQYLLAAHISQKHGENRANARHACRVPLNDRRTVPVKLLPHPPAPSPTGEWELEL